jgi:hypothetical protein
MVSEATALVLMDLVREDQDLVVVVADLARLVPAMAAMELVD